MCLILATVLLQGRNRWDMQRFLKNEFSLRSYYTLEFVQKSNGQRKFLILIFTANELIKISY